MRITTKDFLRHHPDATLDILTPSGLISLQPWQAQRLLAPNGSNIRLRVCGTKETVIASDILNHIVFRIVQYRYPRNNHYFLLTNPPDKADKLKYHPAISYEQLTFDISA